jgi:hypothetical protein
MPTVAVSVKDSAERPSAFDRDFPHLAKRQSETDLYQNNLDLFAVLDLQYRFQLLESVDGSGNKEIFDHKTGTLICAPTSEDRGMEALRKLALYQHAFNRGLAHRSALAELTRNLAAEQADREHREFDKLMAYAGYVRNKAGDLEPTAEKARELLSRNPSKALDDLYGRGWREGKK